MELSIESDIYKHGLMHVVRSSFLRRNYQYSPYWDVSDLDTLCNADFDVPYKEKKSIMVQAGRTKEEWTERQLMGCYTREEDVKFICESGLQCGQPGTTSYLGDGTKGVTLGKYADILLESCYNDGFEQCWIVVYKVLLGRQKEVLPFQTPPFREPAPDADCHVSLVQPASIDDCLRVQEIKSQVFMYDRDEAGKFLRRPRQCVPIAYVKLKRCRFITSPPATNSTVPVELQVCTSPAVSSREHQMCTSLDTSQQESISLCCSPEGLTRTTDSSEKASDCLAGNDEEMTATETKNNISTKISSSEFLLKPSFKQNMKKLSREMRLQKSLDNQKSNGFATNILRRTGTGLHDFESTRGSLELKIEQKTEVEFGGDYGSDKRQEQGHRNAADRTSEGDSSVVLKSECVDGSTSSENAGLSQGCVLTGAEACFPDGQNVNEGGIPCGEALVLATQAEQGAQCASPAASSMSCSQDDATLAFELDIAIAAITKSQELHTLTQRQLSTDDGPLSGIGGSCAAEISSQDEQEPSLQAPSSSRSPVGSSQTFSSNVADPPACISSPDALVSPTLNPDVVHSENPSTCSPCSEEPHMTQTSEHTSDSDTAQLRTNRRAFKKTGISLFQPKRQTALDLRTPAKARNPGKPVTDIYKNPIFFNRMSWGAKPLGSTTGAKFQSASAPNSVNSSPNLNSPTINIFEPSLKGHAGNTSIAGYQSTGVIVTEFSDTSCTDLEEIHQALEIGPTLLVPIRASGPDSGLPLITKPCREAPVTSKNQSIPVAGVRKSQCCEADISKSPSPGLIDHESLKSCIGTKTIRDSPNVNSVVNPMAAPQLFVAGAEKSNGKSATGATCFENQPRSAPNTETPATKLTREHKYIQRQKRLVLQHGFISGITKQFASDLNDVANLLRAARSDKMRHREKAAVVCLREINDKFTEMTPICIQYKRLFRVLDAIPMEALPDDGQLQKYEQALNDVCGHLGTVFSELKTSQMKHRAVAKKSSVTVDWLISRKAVLTLCLDSITGVLESVVSKCGPRKKQSDDASAEMGKHLARNQGKTDQNSPVIRLDENHNGNSKNDSGGCEESSGKDSNDTIAVFNSSPAMRDQIGNPSTAVRVGELNSVTGVEEDLKEPAGENCTGEDSEMTNVDMHSLELKTVEMDTGESSSNMMTSSDIDTGRNEAILDAEIKMDITEDLNSTDNKLDKNETVEGAEDKPDRNEDVISPENKLDSTDIKAQSNDNSVVSEEDHQAGKETLRNEEDTSNLPLNNHSVSISVDTSNLGQDDESVNLPTSETNDVQVSIQSNIIVDERNVSNSPKMITDEAEFEKTRDSIVYTPADEVIPLVPLESAPAPADSGTPDSSKVRRDRSGPASPMSDVSGHTDSQNSSLQSPLVSWPVVIKTEPVELPSVVYQPMHTIVLGADDFDWSSKAEFDNLDNMDIARVPRNIVKTEKLTPDDTQMSEEFDDVVYSQSSTTTESEACQVEQEQSSSKKPPSGWLDTDEMPPLLTPDCAIEGPCIVYNLKSEGPPVLEINTDDIRRHNDLTQSHDNPEARRPPRIFSVPLLPTALSDANHVNNPCRPIRPQSANTDTFIRYRNGPVGSKCFEIPLERSDFSQADNPVGIFLKINKNGNIFEKEFCQRVLERFKSGAENAQLKETLAAKDIDLAPELHENQIGGMAVSGNNIESFEESCVEETRGETLNIAHLQDQVKDKILDVPIESVEQQIITESQMHKCDTVAITSTPKLTEETALHTSGPVCGFDSFIRHDPAVELDGAGANQSKLGEVNQTSSGAQTPCVVKIEPEEEDFRQDSVNSSDSSIDRKHCAILNSMDEQTKLVPSMLEHGALPSSDVNSVDPPRWTSTDIIRSSDQTCLSAQVISSPVVFTENPQSPPHEDLPIGEFGGLMNCINIITENCYDDKMSRKRRREVNTFEEPIVIFEEDEENREEQEEREKGTLSPPHKKRRSSDSSNGFGNQPAKKELLDTASEHSLTEDFKSIDGIPLARALNHASEITDCALEHRPVLMEGEGEQQSMDNSTSESQAKVYCEMKRRSESTSRTCSPKLNESDKKENRLEIDHEMLTSQKNFTESKGDKSPHSRRSREFGRETQDRESSRKPRQYETHNKRDSSDRQRGSTSESSSRKRGSEDRDRYRSSRRSAEGSSERRPYDRNRYGNTRRSTERTTHNGRHDFRNHDSRSHDTWRNRQTRCPTRPAPTTSTRRTPYDVRESATRRLDRRERRPCIDPSQLKRQFWSRANPRFGSPNGRTSDCVGRGTPQDLSVDKKPRVHQHRGESKSRYLHGSSKFRRDEDILEETLRINLRTLEKEQNSRERFDARSVSPDCKITGKGSDVERPRNGKEDSLEKRIQSTPLNENTACSDQGDRGSRAKSGEDEKGSDRGTTRRRSLTGSTTSFASGRESVHSRSGSVDGWPNRDSDVDDSGRGSLVSKTQTAMSPVTSAQPTLVKATKPHTATSLVGNRIGVPRSVQATVRLQTRNFCTEVRVEESNMI